MYGRTEPVQNERLAKRPSHQNKIKKNRISIEKCRKSLGVPGLPAFFHNILA
ncbi:hypothetical protein CLOSTASPAR_01318 [[Clostridium] asparagiforme DSM 15981]|uniref:Uncharacterized protein n=1 Tax=[Clostridium] asparagiforme DSM 15981 TaxID=518636 RepID=C0CWF2_9FIRM|nr:hypothetical protein CLOSTASPAR_01318 [[Clostridium] asparagiforme DSM 15981]